MHYLRWKTPDTLLAWNNAGLHYDTTLGYAEAPGFRCGTCHEYPAYNPLSHKMLKTRIRPLIAMEVSIIDKQYMGLGEGEQAFDKFSALIKECRAVDGCFTLLWHNSNFRTKASKTLYQKILSFAAQ